MDYIVTFDVCCLLETFTLDRFDSDMYFEDYHIFKSPSTKLSHYGRRRGGVVIVAQKSKSHLTEEIECEYDNMNIQNCKSRNLQI